MKSFALDFQFGTNVLPEEDGENIIKYKNGYVYKEIFLPLNYQDTIGKMLIKNIINGRKVKFITETFNKLCSKHGKLRKEVASEANEAKLLEVRNNYAVFIKKLEQLNKKAKASSVKKVHISEPNKSTVSK